ncbi:MAG: MaoC family dehydratase N-terminal domain-containing protein, partial [Rhodovibrionaceae bacterium]
MQAALGDPRPPLTAGDALPPLWHWLYFWEVAASESLGLDGHAARGEFLPPLPLPRRMWAGGRIAFHAPLRLGEAVQRRSAIASVTQKQGRSGPLAFVTVKHEIGPPGGQTAVSEEHDIVYRAAPDRTAPPARAQTAPEHADWRQEVTPGPVLLFRYSALTFNSHRIHYDADYVREAEGYPGLVVHGPLLATLLLGAAGRATGTPARRFSFRVQKPAIAGRLLALAGKGGDLWVADTEGEIVLRGSLAP